MNLENLFTHTLFRIGFFLVIIIVGLFFFQQYKTRDRCKNCNLIIISLDAQRPDHMGVYGYERNTTPNIDKWAKKAMVFTNTYTETPMTYPSFVSLMTGEYAVKTGIFSNRVVTNPDESVIASVSAPLIPKEVKTLAEILKEHSYTTVAYNANPELSPEVANMNRGFDTFNEAYKENYKDYEEKIVKAPIKFLKENKSNKFFMWLHFIDPHTPYTPPGNFQCTFASKEHCEEVKTKKVWALEQERKEFEGCKDSPIPNEKLELYKALYDGEVASNDAFVGKILDAIEKEGLGENTMVMFYSDHGEGFDHNYYFNHPGVLFNSTTKIVYMLKNPKKKAGFYSELTQNSDIFQTLLFQLGLQRKIPTPSKYAYGVTLTKGAFSITDGRYKYMKFLTDTCNPTGKSEVLYELTTDPHESIDILDKQPEKTEELKKALQKHWEKEKINDLDKEEPKQKIQEDTINKIRNLGY